MIKNKYFRLVLKIFVTIACFYWVFSKQSLDFATLKKGFQPLPVLLILTVMGLVYVVNNWRWLILYKSQGFQISHYESLQLMLIGIFFNSIIPGGVSGDIVRGMYLSKSTADRKVDSATSLLMDRLLGLMMMLFFALASFFFNLDLLKEKGFATVFVVLCLLFLGLVLGFCTMLSTRVYGLPVLKKLYSIRQLALFRRVHEAVQKYRHKPGAVFAALGISLISQFLTISSLMLMAYFMGLQAPAEVFFFCVPIGMVLTAIPISPAGIGYGQAVYMYLFDLRMGMQTTIGANIITQSQILGLFWIALGGICYMFFKQSANHGKA